MANEHSSTRTDSHTPSPETSTTRRAILAGMAAVPAVALPITATAAIAPLPESDARLAQLLARIRSLKARTKQAAKNFDYAEEAKDAAAEAHPYPIVTYDDEVNFNYSVRAGHDWTPERLAYFAGPEWRHALERGYGGRDTPDKAEARAARMAELAPIVAAVTEARRPFDEAEESAEESYNALLDEEEALLAESADIAATTMDDLKAKAEILGLFNNGLNVEAEDATVRARDAILRDVMMIGGVA